MFSTGTPTPSETEEPEGEPRAVVQGAFWMRMKESYHTSLDTFSIPSASLTIFITYVIPILIAGAACCIPLQPAFEGRAANPTFLWVVYPLQQFLRFMGVLGSTIAYGKCIIHQNRHQNGWEKKMATRNFAINMGVAAMYTLILWALLLHLSSTWAFPVPFFDVYTGPLCVPLVTATAAVLLDRFGSGGRSSVAPAPPPLAQAALDGVKLKLHGKLADDSPYRMTLAFAADGLPSFLVVIPLSSGLFHATSGYWQNVAVLGLAGVRLGYRLLARRNSEQWLQPDWRFFFIFFAGFCIDLVYEFHCALLFGSYDTAVSMMIPPVIDLLDNIWAIRKCVNEKNMLAREELIVLIVAKELTELISSIGALIIFPIIWSTNRRSFFLIDEISPQNFQRGMIGLGVDLITELAVLVVFSKILATRFQVKLLNLILSMTETVGKTTMFVFVASVSTYISSFMMYHYGGDASFKFEWLGVDDFAEVCEERQSEGRSCYA
jgi:hypothetical protein